MATQSLVKPGLVLLAAGFLAASDPIADIETIETELMLADLESLERRVVALEKRAKGSDKEAKETLDLVNRCLGLLREGRRQG